VVAAHEGDGAPPGPTATVLFLEDDALNVDLVRRILRRRPHVEVVSAGTARAGLALAAERRPDLVLLDLHLPDATGWDVLARLAGDPRTAGLPVVVLSGDAPPDRRTLEEAGVAAFLSKPFDFDSLLALVDRYAAG
jgi:CheY-like chemotaxis protein